MIIKIKVENLDQAQQVTEVLEEAEVNGDLDFSFSVRFYEDEEDSE